MTHTDESPQQAALDAARAVHAAAVENLNAAAAGMDRARQVCADAQERQQRAAQALNDARARRAAALEASIAAGESAAVAAPTRDETRLEQALAAASSDVSISQRACDSLEHRHTEAQAATAAAKAKLEEAVTAFVACQADGITADIKGHEVELQTLRYRLAGLYELRPGALSLEARIAINPADLRHVPVDRMREIQDRILSEAVPVGRINPRIVAATQWWQGQIQALLQGDTGAADEPRAA